jgi:protoporphyrinogen oxidase
VHENSGRTISNPKNDVHATGGKALCDTRILLLVGIRIHLPDYPQKPRQGTVRVAILGAGIAGLSVARFLQGRVARLDVFEAEAMPGGLARSFQWHGFDCDIAPHRLYTSSQTLRDELHMLVRLHRVKRKSRILLRNHWLRDPVNAAELLWKFFPVESAGIIRSFLQRPDKEGSTFESLVLKQYGRALHDLFFAPYSEKLFGIPSSQISPVWGKKKLRMGGIRDLLWRNSKLYFRDFLYPSDGGYGSIAQSLYNEVRSCVHLRSRVIAVNATGDDHSSRYRIVVDDKNGASEVDYDVVVSTIPAPEFVRALGGRIDLSYRKAVLTYFLLATKEMSSNHWLYFADRDKMLNRVAEFRHFAWKSMPDDKTVICCETTDLANYSMESAADVLKNAGLIVQADVLDGREIHLEHAYPVYDLDYQLNTDAMKVFLRAFPGVFTLGRQADFVHLDVDEIYLTAKNLAGDVVRHARTRAV